MKYHLYAAKLQCSKQHLLQVKPELLNLIMSGTCFSCRHFYTPRYYLSRLYKCYVLLLKTLTQHKQSISKSVFCRIVVENMGDVDADGLKSAAEYLVDILQDPAAVILGSSPGDGKVSLVAAFSPGVVKLGMQAGKFVGCIAKLCGGGGGGKPNFAQAGGRKAENLPGALEKARDEIVAAISSKSS